MVKKSFAQENPKIHWLDSGNLIQLVNVKIT